MDLKIGYIKERHSTRLYQSKPVDKEVLEQLIYAASLSPSGKNLQPWNFAIVNDKDTISKISKHLLYSKWLRKSPCVIAVFLSHEKSYDLVKDSMAIGAAIQNMLLESSANGLSTCWVSECVGNENIQDILGVNDQYKLMALITVGYEANNKFNRVSRKEIQELLLS